MSRLRDQASGGDNQAPVGRAGEAEAHGPSDPRPVSPGVRPDGECAGESVSELRPTGPTERRSGASRSAGIWSHAYRLTQRLRRLTIGA